MIEIASCSCNQCGEAYTLTQFECTQCHSKIEGNYLLPRLARLSPDERQFVELFLLTGGNIKKMEKPWGFPTQLLRINWIRLYLSFVNKF